MQGGGLVRTYPIVIPIGEGEGGGGTSCEYYAMQGDFYMFSAEEGYGTFPPGLACDFTELTAIALDFDCVDNERELITCPAPFIRLELLDRHLQVTDYVEHLVSKRAYPINMELLRELRVYLYGNRIRLNAVLVQH